MEHHRSRVTLITSAYLHLVSSFSGQLLSYEAANFREKLFPKVLFLSRATKYLTPKCCSTSISTIKLLEVKYLTIIQLSLAVFSSFSSYIIYGLIGSNSDTRLMTPTFRVIIVMETFILWVMFIMFILVQFHMNYSFSLSFSTCSNM